MIIGTGQLYIWEEQMEWEQELYALIRRLNDELNRDERKLLASNLSGLVYHILKEIEVEERAEKISKETEVISHGGYGGGPIL